MGGVADSTHLPHRFRDTLRESPELLIEAETLQRSAAHRIRASESPAASRASVASVVVVAVAVVE